MVLNLVFYYFDKNSKIESIPLSPTHLPLPCPRPGCPVTLTHLFLWLTWAPLVARKRAAASFPASAARCSKQFPRRKWAYSFFSLNKNEVQSHTTPHPDLPHHLHNRQAHTWRPYRHSLYAVKETRTHVGGAKAWSGSQETTILPWVCAGPHSEPEVSYVSLPGLD